MEKLAILQKRFNSMKQEAQLWTPAWKDLSRYIKPTRGFFDDLPNKGKLLDHKTIVDGHPARALRILATGMMNGLTSPARPWFRLALKDTDQMKYKPVKMWLEQSQNKIFDIFSQSNIYDTLYSTYEEAGQFGTAAFTIIEDHDDIIRSRFFTIGEYFLSCDNVGRVNGFGREYWQTVGQMVQEYGFNKCSERVQGLYKNNQIDEWIKINHLIEYNDKRIPSNGSSRNFLFRSCYWEEGCSEGKYLKESGYRTFPIISPRWETTNTSQIYGYSPAWDSLGDIKMLQNMRKDQLKALDKVIDPPMQIDSSVDGDADFLPGGITRFSATLPNSGAKPAYQISPDLKTMSEEIMNVKSDISKTFYSDLFMMLSAGDSPRMTAREVTERHEEKLIMLGSVLNKLQQECLNPMIARTFDIGIRRGFIAPAPEELQGVEYTIEYISILAQAQKMVATSSIDRAVEFVGTIAQAKPAVLDLIDEDELVNTYSGLVGLPANILHGADEVAAIRAEKQKQAEQQRKMQNVADAAGIAKTLGDTKVGNSNALSSLMGMDEARV
jgi:hypothetical protein